jgi:hypothetical protein
MKAFLDRIITAALFILFLAALAGAWYLDHIRISW